MISVRPWALDDAARAEIFRALRFRYFKWDVYACGGCLVLPETMVVSAETHDAVVRAAEGLHAALHRFEERVRREPEALTRLGIPRALHPLIAAEPDRVLQCARYDFFPTEDGRLMVSEFNEDVPGGFNEAHAVPELLGDPGAGLRWEAGLRAAMLEAFRPHGSVALLYATGYSEDLQHMLVLQQWLAEEGHATVLGSPGHLERHWGRNRMLGERVDAAFRYYPAEWMPRLPNFDFWQRHGPGFPMMNPLFRLVRQSKIMFALWWEDAGLGEADRELLRQHAPLTRPFDPAHVEQLRAERDAWVLKRAFGRMGDAVVMGNLVTEKEWEEALRDAAKAPGDWCAQERFAARAWPFASGPLYPTLGAYIVNGRFAGYYSRAAARPFLTHEALHVATAVQAA